MRNRFLTIFLLLAGTLLAQNNTNSPYSRFGYGELNDNAIGANRAMGGLSVGMRQNNVINPNNPAAFSAIDSTTFMMDLGASLLGTFYNDSRGSNATINGNLEYLNLQFPIWKYFGMSVGVMPYSATGYSFALSDSIGSNAHYTQSYSGSGGVTHIYGGFSANILNWLAFGINVYYMWGDITNYRGVSFTESNLATISEESIMHISDYRLRYGAQFFHTFDKHSFTLGGIFEMNKNLNGKFTRVEITTNDTTKLNDAFSLPMVWGAGISYVYDKRLTVGVDYTRTDWSKAKYFGVVDSLVSRSKLIVGVEYRHNPTGRSYAERMYWRVGASMSDSYVRQAGAKDYCVSVGMGFPLRSIGTIINTTFEYGHRGTPNTLQENWLRFTLSASIAENWFMKRRL